MKLAGPCAAGTDDEAVALCATGMDAAALPPAGDAGIVYIKALLRLS